MTESRICPVCGGALLDVSFIADEHGGPAGFHGFDCLACGTLGTDQAISEPLAVWLHECNMHRAARFATAGIHDRQQKILELIAEMARELRELRESIGSRRITLLTDAQGGAAKDDARDGG